MHGIAIHQIHVFLQGMVHEGQSIGPVRIIFLDSPSHGTEPFDLVAADAVFAGAAEAPVSAGAEHEDAADRGVRIPRILDVHHVCKSMEDGNAEVFITIGSREGHVLQTLQVKHLFLIGIGFEVVVAGDHGPGNLDIIHQLSESVVVVLPELLNVLLLVPVEAGN